MKRKIKKALTLDIAMSEDNVEIVVSEPESGERTPYSFPYSADEHPEFNESIGNELYSWLSLWRDELEELQRETNVDKPTTLYHATFRAYLPSIMTDGLGAVQHKSWVGSADAIVCLADDPDRAASFAECADAISDEVYNSGVVVLEADVRNLDIQPDRNIVHGYDIHEWEYAGVISPCNLKVVR